MMLEFMSSATLLFFLLSTLIGALAIFYLKKQAQLHLPPSPFALPIVGHLHLLGPLIHQSLHNLSSLYGPLLHLRLGSVPCVVASTPELAKQFLKIHELSFSSRQHSIATQRLTYNYAFAFAPYGPYWKFLKKLCINELLSSRSLNHSLPTRAEELHRLLQLLMKKAEAGEAVNVSEEIVKLTNNVISQMMLSIRCSGTKGEAKEARNLVHEVTRIFGEFNVSDFILMCTSLDLQGFGKRIEDIHERYDVLLEKIITNREELRKRKPEAERIGEDDMKDFLDILLDILEDNNSDMKLTRDHVKALVLDFLTAATDTSATAIEWALAELINNPTVLKKAQEEIDEVVGEHRIVEESDGPNLPYIQTIIKETLRLHPPIPMIHRKSTQDCKINGYNIPANTMLFVNTWSIGRNPKYWESPLDFKPERFLQPGKGGPMGLIDVKGQHFQLLPFGSGRRGCPGISLAMLELPTVLAAMIQCFDWKVVHCPGEKMNGGDVVDMTERPGLTAPRAHDLLCVPVARISLLGILDQ